MKRLDMPFGLASTLAPILCFVIDSHTRRREDEFGVVQHLWPHFLLIHAAILLTGASAGIYAGVRRSRFWFCATGANIVALVLYILVAHF